MCSGIIGKKLGMSGVFSPEGEYIPVTVVQAGPCVVTQVKSEATDGYNALQLGFGEKKSSRVNKPIKGHLKKSGDKFFGTMREFRMEENPEKFSTGQTITLEIFKVGEKVNVTGTTKGRGFSGVIKRHGFHGGKNTHGCKSHRVPGSVGTSAWPSRILKGKKMPGHHGNSKKTIRNLKIVDIRTEDNIIMLKGALPGPRSGLVFIKKIEEQSS
jgi:large subunit ribosomal protein L3